ncbi:type 1 periplasmic-binding domain-containing protein [Bacteroides timonensis]|uniref:hypothetical protein n=1 Tax=Bacteroides timonensis TaxID=1470345 RepID=UPI001FCB7766|nr:hypothetical protein [Bacteroides timonensis]
MKRISILFGLMLLMCLVNAQNKENSPFLFPDFQEVTVLFKDGSQYNEKMNYNLLVEKFYFIDRVDKRVKELSNPQDIQVIKFGNRVFYTEGNKGIEILPTNPVLHVQYKGNMRKEASIGAYGQSSETSSMRTYGGTYGNGGERYNFSPEKLILGNRYNIYWLERKGKKKAFKNFKQFIKLYPNHKESLEKFINDNHVNFNDVQQIKMLCIYADAL